MRIIVENLKVNNIPVLNVFQENITKSAPIILMLHGFNHYKEFHLKDAYYFACRGYFVTLFDAYKHGEMADERLKKLQKFEIVMEMPAISYETCKYFDQLVDYHKQVNLADFSRIGIMGFSFGGNVVYEYLSGEINSSIKAAVPIISFPPMIEVVEHIISINPAAAEFFKEPLLEKLKANEAGSQLRKLKNFPILMLNGVVDPLTPIEVVRRFYREMKQKYTDPDKVMLIEYPGLGHESAPEMMEEAAKWFEQYLK